MLSAVNWDRQRYRLGSRAHGHPGRVRGTDNSINRVREPERKILHVCLRSISWRASDVKSPKSRMDGPNGWTDESRGPMDPPSDGVGTYPGIGGVKRGVGEMDGILGTGRCQASKRKRIELQMHRRTSEPVKRSPNCQTYPLKPQDRLRKPNEHAKHVHGCAEHRKRDINS